jgi:hypothetical protein
MSLRNIIKQVLKEETSPQAKVLSMIDKIGFQKTAGAVGGFENLLKILGKDKEIVMQYLLSFFDNVELRHIGNGYRLSKEYYTFLEKSSSFWGGSITVYDDYLFYFLKDIPYKLYFDYRRDLLKELIRRYPELNDGSEVIVYADMGKYKKLDKFYVDEEIE